MSITRFDPHIYKVDASGRITHFSGYREDDPSQTWNWYPVCDILENEYSVPSIMAKTHRLLEGFRDEWVVRWPLTEAQKSEATNPAKDSLLINPFTGNAIGRYMLNLIEYPKFIGPHNTVHVGGVQFVGTLKATKDSKQIPKNVFKECSNAPGGAFDYANQHLAIRLEWIGQRYGCPVLAMNAIGRLGALIRCILDVASLAEGDFQNLLGLYDDLAKALHALSMAVAKHATCEHPGSQSEGKAPVGERYTHDTYGIIGKTFTVKKEKQTVSYTVARKCTSEKGLAGIAFSFGRYQTPLELYSQRATDIMGKLYTEYLLRIRGKSKTEGFIELPDALKRNYSNAFPKSKRSMMKQFIETGKGPFKGQIRLVLGTSYL